MKWYIVLNLHGCLCTKIYSEHLKLYTTDEKLLLKLTNWQTWMNLMLLIQVA